MGSIALSTWGHAGLRLERQGHRLVLDPGMFTDPAILEGASAVLVTHEHPDHVVPEQLAPVVAAAGLPVWAPSGVVEALAGAGAPREHLRSVRSGEAFTAAGFEVQALGGTHAVIHPKLPPVANLGYLVEGAILHPGDSFAAPPEGCQLQLLALPVSAPWLKLAEAVDYAAQVAPALAVPIHDAILSDAGKALVDRIAAGLLGPVPYRRATPGEELELTGS